HCSRVSSLPHPLSCFLSSLSLRPRVSALFPYTTLFRSHFFNPVAVMPLIEVVKTPHTDDETLSTAMVTAAKLFKTAVITADTPGDRKSTRLNSSHVKISYAVFCLKKKKNTSEPNSLQHL